MGLAEDGTEVALLLLANFPVGWAIATAGEGLAGGAEGTALPEGLCSQEEPSCRIGFQYEAAQQ